MHGLETLQVHPAGPPWSSEPDPPAAAVPAPRRGWRGQSHRRRLDRVQARPGARAGHRRHLPDGPGRPVRGRRSADAGLRRSRLRHRRRRHRRARRHRSHGRPRPRRRHRHVLRRRGPEDTVRVSPYDIFRREITIKGSFAEISSFPATIEALRSGRVRTDGLITHRFAINDYAAALQALRTDRTAHKIVITI